jgi:hypothetical protein
MRGVKGDSNESAHVTCAFFRIHLNAVGCVLQDLQAARAEAESRALRADAERRRMERARQEAKELEAAKREAVMAVWKDAEPSMLRAAQEHTKRREATAEGLRNEVARFNIESEAAAQQRVDAGARRAATQEAGRLLAAAQARKEADELLQATARVHARPAEEWGAARAAHARMQAEGLEFQEADRLGSRQGQDGGRSLRNESPGRSQRYGLGSVQEQAQVSAAETSTIPWLKDGSSASGDLGNPLSRFPQSHQTTFPEGSAASKSGLYAPASPGIDRGEGIHNKRLLLEKARMEALEAAKRKAEEAAQKVAELQKMRRQFPGSPSSVKQGSEQQLRSSQSPTSVSTSANLRHDVEAAALRTLAMMDGSRNLRDKVSQYTSDPRAVSKASFTPEGLCQEDSRREFSKTGTGTGPQVLWSFDQPNHNQSIPSLSGNSPVRHKGSGTGLSSSVNDARYSGNYNIGQNAQDLAVAFDLGRRLPAAMDGDILNHKELTEVQESNAARNAGSWQRKAKLFGSPSLSSPPQSPLLQDHSDQVRI